MSEWKEKRRLSVSNADLRLLGREVFRGAWDFLIGRLLWVCLILLALKWAMGGFDRDDTDSNSERSGLHLRIDYGTGCQYLETKEGSLAPRLGANGRQVCK